LPRETFLKPAVSLFILSAEEISPLTLSRRKLSAVDFFALSSPCSSGTSLREALLALRFHAMILLE
jgi:hypothetical protein